MKSFILFSAAALACIYVVGQGETQTTRPDLQTGITAGKMPDLIITSAVSLDKKYGPHKAAAKVFIKNQGTAPAGKCKLKVLVTNGKGLQAVHLTDVPALAPGAQVGVLISTGPDIHPRLCQFYVDSTLVVLESNEKNNRYALKIF